MLTLRYLSFSKTLRSIFKPNAGLFNVLTPVTKLQRSLRRNYSEKVLDHFQNPRNVGSLDKAKKTVGTGLVGAPACGDVMKLQLEIENDRIIDAKFKTFGCGGAMASSSYATQLVKGMTVQEAEKISNMDIANYLELPPVKLHCSLLAEEAIAAAITDYKKKNKDRI